MVGEFLYGSTGNGNYGFIMFLSPAWSLILSLHDSEFAFNPWFTIPAFFSVCLPTAIAAIGFTVLFSKRVLFLLQHVADKASMNTGKSLITVGGLLIALGCACITNASVL